VLGRDVEHKFWAKLEDLALDISLLLEMLRDRPVASPLAEPTMGMTVYLAEATSDLSFERDQIRRELQARGYSILPDRPLPLSSAELERVVRENLEHVTLSIHLIGGYYGIVPESGDRSIVELQNALATECSQRRASFSRLIWLPTNLPVKEARQEAFINVLKNDPALQLGDDLLQTSLEALKTVIQDKLTVRRVAEGPDTAPDFTRIYLITGCKF
jgi:hypothetical protein